MINNNNFGEDFKWGVTISAFQNEGAAQIDEKGLSIWDTFTATKTNVKNGDEIGESCGFYTKYEDDIQLTKELGFDSFRFSISWTRLLPQGYGEINHKGIEFYNKVINCCLKNGLNPWVTIYHWDLPQKLEDNGGWTNRQIIDWFSEYVKLCVKSFGDRVTNWIVMNEPMTFVGLGYFMGYHAPQRIGITSFLKAAHHAVLAMAEGGRMIRNLYPHANIGIGLSCSYVKPINQLAKNKKAALRMEALLNRFFIEPLLGLGYPSDVMPSLQLIKSYFKKGDEHLIAFDFDFIGLQYYFRVVAKYSLSRPILFADEVSPLERKSNLNVMNLDVYPKGIYKVLKQFHERYPQVKKILISESGVCYPDFQIANHIHDVRRKKYHQNILKNIYKAKEENVPVEGYFVWTLVDNFEWKEGFEPRFGIVYTNYTTQERIIKNSGLWFKKFLRKA